MKHLTWTALLAAALGSGACKTPASSNEAATSTSSRSSPTESATSASNARQNSAATDAHEAAATRSRDASTPPAVVSDASDAAAEPARAAAPKVEPTSTQARRYLEGFSGKTLSRKVAGGALTPSKSKPCGVEVTSLATGHPLSKAGLQPGDVVTAWGATAVSTWEALVDAINAGKAPDLRIERTGEAQVLPLP